MNVYFNNGLHVIHENTHVVFDPTNVYVNDQVSFTDPTPVDLVFISHGHADHCNALLNYKGIPCVMHPATARIIEMYQSIDDPIFMLPGERKTYKGIDIECFNAGHCLGSLQFRVTFDGTRFVYTGDVDTTGSGTNYPAPVVTGDILAIETTLGDPAMPIEVKEVHFEEIRQIAMDSLNKSRPVAFYCYPLGIAQEIVYLFNNMEENGFSINVDSIPLKICKWYEQYQYPLGNYQDLYGVRGKSVIVANLSWIKHGETIAKRIGREPVPVVISGKKLNSFPHVELSFHSTFPELVSYVKESGAGVVFPFHKKHVEFTRYLVNSGCTAIDPHVRS